MGEENSARKSVLIVEDDEDLRGAMVLALARAGYQVQEAGDGREALARIAEQPPDLILLDLRMPGMDGREFARRFRAERGQGVPLVVVTADMEARQAAQEIGAQGWLDKPFRIPDLRRTVEEHLGPADSRVHADGSYPAAHAP